MTSPPEALPRYACGCTHDWVDELLAGFVALNEEWFRRLREGCPDEGDWHFAGREILLRCHVWRNGRWRTATPLEDHLEQWEFLDDDDA